MILQGLKKIAQVSCVYYDFVLKKTPRCSIFYFASQTCTTLILFVLTQNIFIVFPIAHVILKII